MKTFENNTTYKMGFAGDSNLFVFFTVVRRTAKSVWIKEQNSNADSFRCGIKVYNGEEYVMPYGRYSMAPVLNAKRAI